MSRKQWNTIMHYKNGNKQQNKPKKHLKVLLINKGTSHIDTHKIVIKNNITRSKADLVVISEAQVGLETNTLDTDYPEYNKELKFMQGAAKSRIAVLIRKGISYKRISNIEHDDTSAIFLKIRMTHSKNINVVAIYRQWNLPPETLYWC